MARNAWATHALGRRYASGMPDGDAFLSPEPIRFMYDSDEDHVRAWLAWAELTPGGWRARLADKGQAG